MKKNPFLKIIIIASLLSLSLSSYSSGLEIGIQTLGANQHPDFPLTEFAAGRIGIIQPNYGSSYLLVTYYYLNNRPLNKNAQQNVISVWKNYFDQPLKTERVSQP